jgi:hypothetical protein
MLEPAALVESACDMIQRDHFIARQREASLAALCRAAPKFKKTAKTT